MRKFNILWTLLAFCVGYLLIYGFIKGYSPIFDNIKIISVNILVIFYYILVLLVVLGIITNIVRITSKNLKK